MSDAIGGYFELELGMPEPPLYPDALGFQSARAAFLALLRSRTPSRVWMPWYICSSMIETVHSAGIPISRYAIDETMDIKGDLALEENEWLVYVNYFGLCDKSIDQVLQRFSPDQVVIDNAQAFYSPPRTCLATLYSPRKFFGVPDGGYLVTDRPVGEPDAVDSGSIRRCKHLLERLAVDAETGYGDYRAAEESLAGLEPMRMSQLTRRLLSSIDHAKVRDRRNNNFAMLQNGLHHRNQFYFNVEPSTVPMCYPLLGATAGIRERLISQRIYVPTYWPDMAENQERLPAFEQELFRNLLPLPVDQRYGSDQMQIMLDALRG